MVKQTSRVQTNKKVGKVKVTKGIKIKSVPKSKTYKKVDNYIHKGIHHLIKPPVKNKDGSTTWQDFTHYI